MMQARISTTSRRTPHAYRRRLLWPCILSILVAATMTCGCRPQKEPATTNDTAVAQGELFEAGTPVYDEYFATVHELHAAVETAKLEERDARMTLATMLHLLPTAPSEQILRKLEQRAESLPPMRLVLEEKGDKVERAKLELTNKGRPEESVRNLVTVMEATANADLNLAARMSELPERSHRMHSVGKALVEGTDKEFSSETPKRRQQIRRELEAALEVLVLVANESREVEERARGFIAGMQDVLADTANNEVPAGSRPHGGAPASSPKPKMPEDFNP